MMSGVSAFLWQAALMLLGAYFLGAFIGCWLRRRFNAPPKVAMESRTDTKYAGAAAAAAPSSERFGRALNGDEPNARAPSSEPTIATGQIPVPQASLAVSPSGPETNAEPSGAMGDGAARTASTEPVAAEPVPIAPEAPPPIPIPPEAPPVPVAPAPQQPKPLSPPMSAAAAAAAALAARQAATAHKQDASAPPAPPNPAKPLAKLPAAAPASVAGKMEALVSPTPTVAPDLPASSNSAGQATVAAQIEQAAVPAPTEPDDLTMIEGVTDNDAAALRNAGVTTFAAIAGWTADDVARANGSINGERRIARENWIEQAQLLHRDGSTSYTRRVSANLAPRPGAPPPLASQSSGNGPTVAPAAPSIDSVKVDERSAEPAPPSPPAIPSVSEASDPAPAPSAAPSATLAAGTPAKLLDNAPADPNPEVSRRAAFARERRGFADELQQIDGINTEVEKLLNEQGVTRIAQIAGWSAAEQQRVDQLLGSMNRVGRENWVVQARRISDFSEAVPKPDVSTDAPADDAAGELSEPASNVLPISSVPAVPRHNVRGFRSVRSEALVGANTVNSNNSGDDLKRIRGVGVLIEKRLRAMGYTSYEQIGSWTQSDVDRVNQQLDFRGRIERENWIEQARILAAGGQTEFSRRQERNED